MNPSKRYRVPTFSSGKVVFEAHPRRKRTAVYTHMHTKCASACEVLKTLKRICRCLDTYSFWGLRPLPEPILRLEIAQTGVQHRADPLIMSKK